MKAVACDVGLPIAVEIPSDHVGRVAKIVVTGSGWKEPSVGADIDRGSIVIMSR